MPSSLLVLRLVALFTAVCTALQPLIALVTRLVVGCMFLGTGYRKWTHFDNTVEFFRSLHLPAPTVNAAFIATLELAGGLCLIAGLCTRVFAFLLSCTMVVAILTADRAAFLGAFGGGDQDLLDVTPVPPLLFLSWLMAFGAGAISLDRFCFRKLEKA